MPTISIAQNEFAFESGCTSAAIMSGIFTLASVRIIITKYVSNGTEPKKPLNTLRANALRARRLASLSFGFTYGSVGALP